MLKALKLLNSKSKFEPRQSGTRIPASNTSTKLIPYGVGYQKQELSQRDIHESQVTYLVRDKTRI